MRLGVDILAMDELDELLRREWFRCFAFSESELVDADSLGTGRGAEFLAGRFAAKEAVLKVLGRGLFQGIRPCEVEITREKSGEPRIVLHGSAQDLADEAQLGGVSISLSHKKNLVVAIALGYPNVSRTAGA